MNLSALNEHLARFGYQMKPIDPLAPPSHLLHWLKDGANPITLTAPQYRAEGYDNLVYDLHDIRDMLKHLHSDGIGEGHELVARRRTQATG